MDALLPTLFSSALAALATFAACARWHRSSVARLRQREEESAREREGLLLAGQELRDRLHAANEALELRAESLQRILRASGELKAHLPLDAVLANVVRAASSSLGYRRVLLSLHDRADGVLVPRAHVGLSGAWGELERLRLPVEGGALLEPSGGAGPTTPLGLVLPGSLRVRPASVALVAADQLVGLLELDEPGSHVAGDAADRAILELFASQAVTAIRLARAYETTRLGSLRDPLTGVANHGHFQELLYREIARHARHGERLVLLLVDLDDFKKVNDRFGHPVGDAVLKGVVARLLSSVREMDTVARYGGEEFALVLPRTDAPDGQRVADRLREAVASSPLGGGLPEPLPVSVSVGLAVFPDDATSKGALIECADKALYAAKRTGKNRVVRFAKVPRSAEALLTERT